MEFTDTSRPKYVKILHESMVHNDFQYQLGLNTDHITFNPSGSCRAGGLYFTDINNFYKFLEYGTLIADVEVPSSVEIYADPDGDKWKAASIIISNIRKINELPQWNDSAFCLTAVRSDGYYTLEFVPDALKTEEMCLVAVRQCGHALQFVPDRLKTADVCLAAVRQNGYALEYVPDKFKTSELCLAAVQQAGCALRYVSDKFKTSELCLAAVQEYGYALQYVPKNLKTEAICLAAVQEYGDALRYVPKKLKTEAICLAAVQQDGNNLYYVPDRLKTAKLRLTAKQHSF